MVKFDWVEIDNSGVWEYKRISPEPEECGCCWLVLNLVLGLLGFLAYCFITKG